MKRIITIVLAAAAFSVAASAQDTYYAKMLSQNNYYGTARSVALGNAMTALGGDLGSVNINPAGAAVAYYSQLTLTPGLIFSSTGASYSPDGSETFGSPFRTPHTKFNIPNIGLTLSYFDDPGEFLTGMTMGFVANTTNTFLNYSTARGDNSSTSFLASLAAGANGVSPSNFPRDLYAGYWANQFGEYGPEGSNRYVASNERLNEAETVHYVPGTLDQTSMYNTYGTKTDMAFNLSFNILDCVYVGFNLGIPFMKYRREESFTEAALESGKFPVIFYDTQGEKTVKVPTNYVSSTNLYHLNTNATGVYAKFGFIALPTEHLRIGAAIQTPTLYGISESWYYGASTQFEDSYFNGEKSSSIGEAEYSLRTPYEFNAGIAYTLPGVGLFSVDYELADYSVMKYTDASYDFYSDDSWASTNLVNRTFCGVSHSVRVGTEVKPLPYLSFRAGYTLVTDPEKYWLDDNGKMVTIETVQFLGNSSAIKQKLVESRYFDNITHSVSLGAGYSSPGSFFADFAVRMTAYPVSYYSPYYYGAYDATDSSGRPLNVGAPLERLERNVFDVLLTMGWRF